MKFLNLGCGNCYHPDWINIDLNSKNPEVMSHDLRKGIPFPDESCDVVYHSNIIEHFRRNDARIFMKECFRVLKPGGILRVATPDLEEICRIYLETLTSLKNGDTSRSADYEWILLEMYDQTVREKSGGEMGAYLKQNPIPNEKFVLQRIGDEGRTIIHNIRNSQNKKSINSSSITLDNCMKLLAYFPSILNNKILRPLKRLVFGNTRTQINDIGKFRLLSGEVHQWMYDSYSLGKLMQDAGFINPLVQSPLKSQIPEWNRYHLDVLPDDIERKPDSFYMEAIKPKDYHISE